MELTTEEVSRAFGVSEWAVQRWCKESVELRKRGEKGRFPRVYLLFESRRYGYRIPLSDVLAYAESQSPNVLERAREKLGVGPEQALA